MTHETRLGTTSKSICSRRVFSCVPKRGARGIKERSIRGGSLRGWREIEKTHNAFRARTRKFAKIISPINIEDGCVPYVDCAPFLRNHQVQVSSSLTAREQNKKNGNEFVFFAKHFVPNQPLQASNNIQSFRYQSESFRA